MMGRLIGLIIIFAVLFAFMVSNDENRCTISFGPAKIADVPVFFTVFGSFVLGMLASVPFLVSFAMKKKVSKEHKAVRKPEKTPPVSGGTLDS
jgi:uncharacterized integral membrane protein